MLIIWCKYDLQILTSTNWLWKYVKENLTFRIVTYKIWPRKFELKNLTLSKKSYTPKKIVLQTFHLKNLTLNKLTSYIWPWTKIDLEKLTLKIKTWTKNWPQTFDLKNLTLNNKLTLKIRHKLTTQNLLQTFYMEQNTAPPMSGGISSPGKSSSKNSSQKSGNSSLSKRLQTELMQLMMDDSLCGAGISAFPDGDNLFRWIGTIQGPIKSPYEGMEIKLQMEFPDNYPFKPPTTTFKVKLWKIFDAVF